MEEYKNNAVEKVEKIAGESLPNPPEKKEQALAERRIELAKIREERKARNQKRRAEIKQKKLENKQKNKEEGRSNGGWLAAVISLSIATLALASVLTFSFLMPSENDNALENIYKKSFFDTVEQIDNIDLNLSKILATGDKATMQEYLLNVAINAELAENDLQQLPIQDENKFYTTKLVNQIGDFSKYLSKKISDEQEIDREDLKSLLQLYQANLAFKKSLMNISKEIGDDFSFTSLQNGSTGNAVISNFTELENLSVAYPELIYDGPFSDGLDKRELKGIGGEEISEIEAQEKFKKIFGDQGLEDIKSLGKTSGKFTVFNVQANIKNQPIYAQFSVIGGKLIMFDYAGSCKEVKLEQELAVEKATEFLQSIEINNMKPVWINLANNVYTINFAGENNGIIIYPDMIKIRICAETGMVIGFEACTYYTNHSERTIDNPKVSKADAEKKVSNNIEIESVRMAIVPFGQASEKLCYEFMGKYDDSTYYVYIDAINGRQIQMFKVMEGSEGTLLM